MSRSWNLINMIELCKIRNKYTWAEVAKVSGIPTNKLHNYQRRGDPAKYVEDYEVVRAGLKKLLKYEAKTN